MSNGNGRPRDPLEILEETVMVAIPRGDEELRVTFTRARTAQGKDVAWHSIRVFWKNDQGEWKPGKAGVSIRGGELRAVADALAKAASGGPPRPARTPESPAGGSDLGSSGDRIPF